MGTHLWTQCEYAQDQMITKSERVTLTLSISAKYLGIIQYSKLSWTLIILEENQESLFGDV